MPEENEGSGLALDLHLLRVGHAREFRPVVVAHELPYHEVSPWLRNVTWVSSRQQSSDQCSQLPRTSALNPIQASDPSLIVSCI